MKRGYWKPSNTKKIWKYRILWFNLFTGSNTSRVHTSRLFGLIGNHAKHLQLSYKSRPAFCDSRDWWSLKSFQLKVSHCSSDPVEIAHYSLNSVITLFIRFCLFMPYLQVSGLCLSLPFVCPAARDHLLPIHHDQDVFAKLKRQCLKTLWQIKLLLLCL